MNLIKRTAIIAENLIKRLKRTYILTGNSRLIFLYLNSVVDSWD